MGEVPVHAVTRRKLDLSRSRSPRAYEGEENLWTEDLRRIYRLLLRHVRSLEETKNKKRAPHLAIAIFGPSGSGKSSLLRTLAADINRKTSDHLAKEMGLEERSYTSLRPMDPTTWTSTDQFLYAFLADALEEEHHRQEGEEHGVSQGLTPVQLAFQDVNEYLRVVDDLGNPDDHDPLGLSLQKLERHTSGLRLKKSLGKFVEALAKEMRSEVVLLPVDDLDMAPDHLVGSLQAYQSFLTHPRLVPVFTFTDRMPEELLEVHYDKYLTGTEARRRAEGADRLSISEKLAVQFLARCFPVRNRIRLGPAPARVQRAVVMVRPDETSRSDEDQKIDCNVLELLITSSFLLFGHPDAKDTHQVRAALRPSTLRRQLQVVDAMADCRVRELMAPQFLKMAGDKNPSRALKDKKFPDAEDVEVNKGWPLKNKYLRKRRQSCQDALLGPRKKAENESMEEKDIRELTSSYLLLVHRLHRLEINATWATTFNGAAWSLLNVHRDALRELGLFLEDLYSYSPKELRSVVLDRILSQESVTRRAVLDRWFNRTDYRRSQVLSVLAANIFRPWMKGEEPYGDEEAALQEELKLESDEEDRLDSWDPKHTDAQKTGNQIRDRLTFPATQGLLWFLNVTMGFYLPQILARNWGDAVSPNEPLKSRMSGNGWDLALAPVNAMRIADARQEVFSFGMLFLNPREYSIVIERSSRREHLLLRIWSCCGYSRGRFWSAFSLWRGLAFIGQVLELEHKLNSSPGSGPQALKELEQLIRSHCLAALVPGTLLDRGSSEERLLHSFQQWDASARADHISSLAEDLLSWLAACHHDRIFPIPAGDIWVGWRDCFVRRIHGEYILGQLWPRLNSAYLECHSELLEWQRGKRKVFFDDAETPEPELGSEPRWTSAIAGSVWSDLLLEYWRGCPQILRLLITCPVFLKSPRRFPSQSSYENIPGIENLSLPEVAFDDHGALKGTITGEFCAERVHLKDFVSHPETHHAVQLKGMKAQAETSDNKEFHFVRPAPDLRPSKEK